jgi:hypothetical protein
MLQKGSDGRRPEARLRGWKEIGRRFGVDERTVKRWEVTRGLPIHRVPGEARAPVFAYEGELADWLQSRDARETAVVPPAPRQSPGLLAALALAVLLLALLAFWGWRSASERDHVASERTNDIRQLAQAQIAALSDRLERQPGTVGMRADLARDAAAVLARVAEQPDASPSLRLEAAEAYRRLAAVQSATDRPSLRDRPAARASLAKALALIAADASPAGKQLRAAILIDAARHAAADGALAQAPAMLAAAANIDLPAPRREELALAQSEIAIWQGRYAAAQAQAEALFQPLPADAAGWLRQMRAHELAAEARFYAGDKAGAEGGYGEALAIATAGARRFADQPAFRWAVQRQQWNLGATMLDRGEAIAALPVLAAARTGWMAMAATDPQDESLASWARTARLTYGEGLAAAGQTGPAIAELSQSLADRRRALAGRPGTAEAQRQLLVGLLSLGDVLGAAGRGGEACALIGEAGTMIASMAKASPMTGLDRDSIVRQTEASRARFCRQP